MYDADIIVALGDNAAVADALGLSRSTTANWKERGIPWKMRAKVKELARRKRVSLPADFLMEKRPMHSARLNGEVAHVE